MTKSEKNKTAIIARLKTFSIGVCVLCAVSALFNLKDCFRLLSYILHEEPGMILTDIPRECAEYLLLSAIMVLGALLFFRISREDSPFRHRNVRIVRIIGVLFLIIAFVPAPVVFLFSMLHGRSTTAIDAILFNLPTAAEGLLMLFIGQILHYGTMLQQESDETL